MVVYHRAVDAVDAVTQIDRDGFLFFGLAFFLQYRAPARAPLVPKDEPRSPLTRQHRSVQALRKLELLNQSFNRSSNLELPWRCGDRGTR